MKKKNSSPSLFIVERASCSGGLADHNSCLRIQHDSYARALFNLTESSASR